jgi:hypothetical protein
LQKPLEVSKSFQIPNFSSPEFQKTFSSQNNKNPQPEISQPLVKKNIPPLNWKKGDIIIDKSNLLLFQPSSEYKFSYADEKFLHFENGKSVERKHEQQLFNISLDLRNLKF